jgi:hypothetical protein
MPPDSRLYYQNNRLKPLRAFYQVVRKQVEPGMGIAPKGCPRSKK